jgi:hypothetical protein
MEPEQGGGIEPRVHARDDRDTLGGGKWQVALVESGRVLLGGPEELVGDAHGYLLVCRADG